MNANSMSGPPVGAWEAPAQPEDVHVRATGPVAIVLDASAALIAWGTGHGLAALLIVAVPAGLVGAGWLADRVARRHYRRALTREVVDFDRSVQQACAIGTDDDGWHTITPRPADELATRRTSRSTR